MMPRTKRTWSACWTSQAACGRGARRFGAKWFGWLPYVLGGASSLNCLGIGLWMPMITLLMMILQCGANSDKSDTSDSESDAAWRKMGFDPVRARCENDARSFTFSSDLM